MIAEHDGQPRHALSPDQSDLDLLAARLDSDDGCEPALRKVNGVNSFVGLFKALPQPEGDGFEVRLQQTEVVRERDASNRLRLLGMARSSLSGGSALVSQPSAPGA